MKIAKNRHIAVRQFYSLVDDPTKGYGIFAENMLETANQVAEEQRQKEAS